MTYLDTTIISRVMCTQQNKPNCCLRYPRLRESTKPTKPIKYSVKLTKRWFVAKGVSCALENTTCYNGKTQ